MGKENICIERTCRCCLAAGEMSINNYLENECSKTIAEVLMECTSINVLQYNNI